MVEILRAGKYVVEKGPKKICRLVPVPLNVPGSAATPMGLFESQVLQAMLDISHDPDSPPIIVNISPTRTANSTTDRSLLDTLIKKLDLMKVRCDWYRLDFSPLDDGRPVTSDDWNYFQHWLDVKAKSGLKLHLGVYRRPTRAEGLE